MSVSRTSIGDCVLGEGPHWDSKTQSLLYVDITEGDIYRWNSTTEETDKVHLGPYGRVGFVVPRRSGGYIAGLNRRFVHFDWQTQTTTTIGLPDLQPETNNRFNDGKCDPSGRLWAGTMDDIQVGDKLSDLKTGAGKLYSLEKNCTVNTRQDNVSISNGLAWTADKQTMFYIDSHPRKVFAFDFDIGTGNIDNKRVLVDFDNSSLLGNPDGMTIDCNGNLWVACYGASNVVCFDSNTGKQIRVVDIPDAANVTSCCFGGPNLEDLYVTTARYNTSLEFKKMYPSSGSIFKVTGLGVKGLHEAYEFDG